MLRCYFEKRTCLKTFCFVVKSKLYCKVINYRYAVLNLRFKSGENISKDKLIAVKWVGSKTSNTIKMLSGSGWISFCAKVKIYVMLPIELVVLLFLKAMIKVLLRRDKN